MSRGSLVVRRTRHRSLALAAFRIDHRSRHTATQADRTGDFVGAKRDWPGVAARLLTWANCDGLAVFYVGSPPDLLIVICRRPWEVPDGGCQDCGSGASCVNPWPRALRHPAQQSLGVLDGGEAEGRVHAMRVECAEHPNEDPRKLGVFERERDELAPQTLSRGARNRRTHRTRTQSASGPTPRANSQSARHLRRHRRPASNSRRHALLIRAESPSTNKHP